MSQNSCVADYLLEGKPSDRVCLERIGREHTYGELDIASRRIARALSAKAEKGDRSLLIADNSFFWAAAYLGIMRAGLMCVPLAPGTPLAELQDILRSTEARFAFIHSAALAKLSSEFAGIECFTEKESWGEDGWLADQGLPAIAPDDIAALMFTSGSTGKPRGVMVSHRNIIANTESIIRYLGLTASDRIMAVLPFYYCFGASLLHTHLRVGGSLVIDSPFMYPEAVLTRMAEAGCTGFAGVPSHYQILLRKSSIRKKTFPHLRYVQQAGGRLAPSFISELRQALPGVKVYIMYGQTEATARLSYLDPDLVAKKPGSIGKAIPGVTLRVLDEDGNETAPGQVGEIVATGDNVTKGYWRDPESTAGTFRGGSLHTGDLAVVDEEGCIQIVDRARDILKCGGKRVSSRRIEDQLLEMEELVEAAVVGVQDDELGEAARAFVVPRNPDSKGLEERVRFFCKSTMPAEWVPRQIFVLDLLPKNCSGKVLKAKLKEFSPGKPIRAEEARESQETRMAGAGA